jgi:hypothetical protein
MPTLDVRAMIIQIVGGFLSWIKLMEKVRGEFPLPEWSIDTFVGIYYLAKPVRLNRSNYS